MASTEPPISTRTEFAWRTDGKWDPIIHMAMNKAILEELSRVVKWAYVEAGGEDSEELRALYFAVSDLQEE